MADVPIPPALHWPLQLCLFSTITTYILSIITKNVSQVDRVWTFLPTIYTAYFALLPLWPEDPIVPYITPYTPKEISIQVKGSYSPRALLMLGLVTVWMCRLSYNTYRRGLFNLKDEDYRWVVLRRQVPAWFFQIVNLTFIAGIQNVILLLLGFPAHLAATKQPHNPLSTSDYVLASAALLVLALEFTADNQQYAFQSFKQAYLASPSSAATPTVLSADNKVHNSSGTEVEVGAPKAYDPKAQWPGARLNWTKADAKRGFVTRGLWAWSRHPNFACEQSFWWIINLIPLLAPPPPSLPALSVVIDKLWQVPSIIMATSQHMPLIVPLYLHLKPIIEPLAPLTPALVLSVLFVSSTLYTESITLSKYPVAYAAYQNRVGMFGVPTIKWTFWFRWNEDDHKRIENLVWGDVSEKKDQ